MRLPFPRHAAALLCAAFLASCASGPDRPATRPESGRAAPAAAWSDATRIGYAAPYTSLDQAVRFLGEQYGVGLVSLQGMDVRAVPAMQTDRMPYGQFVAWLAEAVECAPHRESHYYLLLPPGYEILADTRIDTPLPPAHEAAVLSAAFGFNTRLDNALASLGHSLGLTVATDNILGEQRVGELNVHEAPLPRVLEALLRSARVPPGGFRIETGDNHVALLAAPNQARRNPMLNTQAPPAAMRRALDRRVDVYLPAPPPDDSQVAFSPGPMPLAEALPLLSAALEFRVMATVEVADLPVNPCAMRGIRAADALDLIVRQWPLPHFGYEVRADGIVFRAATPKDAPAG